jgi:hypothetical protein
VPDIGSGHLPVYEISWAASELEQRGGRALHARTLFELASSVRRIPGGVTELALNGIIRPAIRQRKFWLRIAVARLVRKLPLGAWWITTVVLAAVAGLWALAATVPLSAGSRSAWFGWP